MSDIMPMGYCPHEDCNYILDKELVDGSWKMMQSSWDHLASHPEETI